MEDTVDVVQGLRLNTVIYCLNGFTYQRTHVRNMTTFCRCRTQMCPARLSYRFVGEPVLTGVHNHDREETFIQELRLRSALVQRGLNEDSPPREIYDEEQLRFPLAVAITFELARNLIRHARRRGAPRNELNSLRAAAEILRQPNHLWMARRLNGNADFLGGAEILEDGVEFLHVHSAPLLNYDGMLLVTLNNSHFGLQVLRVAIQHDMTHQTLGYAFLTRPSVAGLTAALQRLLPLHRLAAVGLIKASYITGLRAALMAVLPNWDFTASPFLLQQCVLEEVARSGLRAMMRNNEHLRQAVQRLACVSFVHPGQRDEAIESVDDFLRQEQPALVATVQAVIVTLRHRLDNFQVSQHLPIVDEGVLRDALLADAVLEREELGLLGVLGTPSPNFWVLYKALRRFDGRAQPQAQPLPLGMVNRAGQQAALRTQRANLPIQEFVRRVGHSISHTSRRLATLIRRNVPFVWGNNEAVPGALADVAELDDDDAANVDDALADLDVANVDDVPAILDAPAAVPAAPGADVPEVLAAAPAVDVPEVLAAAPAVDVPEVLAAAPGADVPEVLAAAPGADVPEVLAAAPGANVPEVLAGAPAMGPLGLLPQNLLEIVNQFPAGIRQAMEQLINTTIVAIRNVLEDERAAAAPPPQPPVPGPGALAASECIICLDRPRVIILVPCGHFGYCEDCSNRIWTCAVCRMNITHRLLVRHP